MNTAENAPNTSIKQLKASLTPTASGGITLYRSLAVAAGVGAVGNQAQAVIVHVDDSPLAVTAATASTAAAQWDIDDNGSVDITFNNGGTWCVTSSGSNGSAGFANGGNASLFENIVDGDTVGPLSSFSQMSCGNLFEADCDHHSIAKVATNNPNYISSDTAFETLVGFSFFNTTSSITNYGIARISGTGFDGVGTNAVFSVLEWVYDDSGAAINASAIPEPSSVALGLGLLSLGAAGLQRHRRNRSAA